MHFPMYCLVLLNYSRFQTIIIQIYASLYILKTMLGVENLQQYSKRIPDDFNNMYLKVKSTLNL